jgi:hypothetical protein
MLEERGSDVRSLTTPEGGVVAELQRLRADHASAVLPVGPADPADLGGKQGTWYERVLADE